MKPALLVSLGYLLGSIPFGVLLTRWKTGSDVRHHGSGNIGATNVSRVAGKKWGALVFLLDAAKGAAPTLIAVHWLPAARMVHAAVAFAAFIGHVFPAWLKLRGGKGVATGFGTLFVLVPVAASVGLLVYAAVLASTRVSALGSLSGGLLASAATFFLRAPAPYRLLTTTLWLFMLYTHRRNLARLWRLRHQ